MCTKLVWKIVQINQKNERDRDFALTLKWLSIYSLCDMIYCKYRDGCAKTADIKRQTVCSKIRKLR